LSNIKNFDIVTWKESSLGQGWLHQGIILNNAMFQIFIMYIDLKFYEEIKVKKILINLIFLCFILTITSQAKGATYIVTNPNDVGNGSLRQALTANFAIKPYTTLDMFLQ